MKKNKNDLRHTPIEVEEEEKRPTIQLEEDVNGEFDENNPDKPIYSFPWTFTIVFAVIIILMVVCLIVIGVNGGFK
ncbi:MAG: hypothetical protein K6F07_03255 [Bacilli bacterium]|nr:hypothetical protein [Bacilli bacterium]